MANKVTEGITLSITGLGSGSTSLAGSITFDQLGTNFTKETQIISASAGTLLDIGSAITEGNLGYLMVRNLDQNNSVDFATDSAMTKPIATIKPGKGNYVSPPAGTVGIYGKAQNADVQICFLAIEA